MQWIRVCCFSLFVALSIFSVSCREKRVSPDSELNDVTGGAKPQPPPPSILEYPGLIPLDGMRAPASDLVYNGNLLSPEKASELRTSGVDLSKLNPREDTDLWRDRLVLPLDQVEDKIDIASGDSLLFNSFINQISDTKNARFGAQKIVNGVQKNFTLSIGRRIHDVLLRKSLLRKMGYLIAPTVFLPRVTLRFSNIREVEIFKKRLAEDTLADPARWIVAEPDDVTLVLQDVVAVDAELGKYNLANGRVAGRVGGRRIMRSLIVPFSLVSMGENINLFSWVPGRVFDRHVILNFENSEDFDCAREDALWALRRLSLLTRNDFTEVAQSAGLPTEVARLLIEKVIARRNALNKLFGLNVPELPFDQKISMSPRLVDGEIIGENFDGHGERFSYGDPDSPLSGQEVWAFIKSKFVTNAFSNGMDYLNKYLTNTDVASAVLQHKIDLVNQSIQKYMTTGRLNEVPLGIFVIPTVGSQLILSRDVVIGSYMGIENKVSLADTVGVNISTGAFLGFDGLPTSVTASGGAQAFVRRTYTHLKPIASLKAAIRAPLRNILVPLLQKELSDGLLQLNEENLRSLDPAARQDTIKKVLGVFKENLAIGESLIVTDSIGGDLSVQVGRSFYDIVSVNAGVGASHVVLGRMHVQRISEDTIVISDGQGQLSKVRLTTGINTLFAPILRLGVELSEGQAKTVLTPLNMDSDERRNPALIQSLNAIRNALIHGSIHSARRVNAGYTLTHHFRDAKTTELLLFSRYAQINGALNVEIRDNASGASKTFYQRRLAQRWGTDFQSFAVDGLNALIAGLTKTNLSINASSSEPAGTVGGKSFLREFVYEGVFEPAAEESDISRIKDGFFSMQYRWRGWSMERQELNRVVSEINEKYNFQFIPETVLGNTSSIQFYDISARTLINPEGLRVLIRHDQGFYQTIFRKYLKGRVLRPECTFTENTHSDEYCRAFSQFFWFRARYGGEWANGNNEKASSHLINAISAVENILEPQDLLEVLGGPDNIFVVSRIEGFRAGDEAGDTAIVGNTFGRLGGMNPLGPINTLSRKLSIPLSEMMATWIRESL